jgi:hypothetical protein
MKKIVLTYGIITGVVLGGLLSLSAPFMKSGAIDFQNGMIYGFTTMILGFSLIYFALASYKKNHGALSIKQGIIAGLLITIIGCLMYAAVWMVLYSTMFPDFAAKYSAYVTEQINASSKSAQEKATEITKLTNQMTMYKNNALYRFGVTFMEPTIVGVLITLIATLILKTKRKEPVTA